MARVKNGAPDLLCGVGTIEMVVVDEPHQQARVEVFRNPKSVPGTAEWFEFTFNYFCNTLRSASGNCERIASDLVHLRPYVTGKLGRDWEEFCRAELSVEPEWLDTIERGVAILKRKGHEGPVTRKQAIEAARPVSDVGAPKGSHNNPSGKTKDPAPEANIDPVNVSSESSAKGGNRSDYLLGRLKRDAAKGSEAAQQALDGYAAGTHASVKAAARAAGIVKPIDPVDIAARALARLTDEQVMALGCRLDARVFELLRAGAEE